MLIVQWVLLAISRELLNRIDLIAVQSLGNSLLLFGSVKIQKLQHIDVKTRLIFLFELF